MRAGMIKSLMDLASRDKDVVLLTGDLGFGLFEDFLATFPEQFFNIGIAEQNMMGIASGLAMDGKKVFVYSIGNFPTLRCLEQIRNDACYHELNVNIISQGGGFSYGGLGMSHHATEDIAIMRALPNVTVAVPSCREEAADMLEQLYWEKERVGYIRLEKTDIDSRGYGEITLGKAKFIEQGEDFSIIATGGLVSEAIKAAGILKQEHNAYCNVVNMHTIKPIDKEAIQQCLKDNKNILTLEEHNIIGGLGGAVAEVMAESGCSSKLIRLGLNDMYSSVVGDQQFLRNYYKMVSKDVVNSVIQFL